MRITLYIEKLIKKNIKKCIFYTMFPSGERPKAVHCDVCRLVILILTAVTPLLYVQLILTPTSVVCGAVVVATVVSLVELVY
jgi:hypothetical protein